MKIDPVHLAFDIDGVVADTMSLFLKIAEADFGISHIRYEDITDYDLTDSAGIDEVVMWDIILRILDGKYALPLNPITDAPEVLRRINSICKPTLFVTARPDEAHIKDWICEVLGVGQDAVEVVATGSFEDKKEVLADRNVAHFVEDRLETCYMLSQGGIRPIVFKQPWNRKKHPFPEVGNWQELAAMIALE
ncbi:MAG: haloacid dehalogenase [Desulfobacterales bacterium]|nr:haloacid dehalogenase [Desulfobacterales bacterium]